jgi:hypothetical protein
MKSRRNLWADSCRPGYNQGVIFDTENCGKHPRSPASNIQNGEQQSRQDYGQGDRHHSSPRHCSPRLVQIGMCFSPVECAILRRFRYLCGSLTNYGCPRGSKNRPIILQQASEECWTTVSLRSPVGNSRARFLNCLRTGTARGGEFEADGE